MTATAELIAEKPPAPPQDPEAAKRKRALSVRSKAALLADLRAIWRECNEVMSFVEIAGEALKAGRMTEAETRDYLGPEFLIWMMQIVHRRRSDGA